MSKYIPKKDGYFVCKNQLLITNTELCKKHKLNLNDINIDNICINIKCKNCLININNLSTVSLDKFNELEEELKSYINNMPNTINKTAIYFK